MKIFKLFGNCIAVKGSKRSIICDLYRSRFETIPNSLYEILAECDMGESYESVVERYGVENESTLAEYFEWLVNQEFGFWCSSLAESNAFPMISLEWDAPFAVTNAIIDIDEDSEFDILNVFIQLEKLGVPHVQLRSFSIRNLDYYADLLSHLEESRIKTIDLLTPYIPNDSEEKAKDLCKCFLRLNSILFYRAPVDKIDKEIHGGLTSVMYSQHSIDSHKNCGFIHTDFFANNIESFSESKNHNSCLNRKISIDVNGEIKNCPSMAKSFGNVRDTPLNEALNKQGFKTHWNINKDQITTCKDCEFRYICTDCRAFTEDPQDIYSKPLKCGYNPYTGEWEEWSKHPLKKKAIDFYELNL